MTIKHCTFEEFQNVAGNRKKVHSNEDKNGSVSHHFYSFYTNFKFEGHRYVMRVCVTFVSYDGGKTGHMSMSWRGFVTKKHPMYPAMIKKVRSMNFYGGDWTSVEECVNQFKSALSWTI